VAAHTQVAHVVAVNSAGERARRYRWREDRRDNGVVYWGDFAKKVKVSVSAFDGGSATGNSKVLGAARVQIDFWDPEDGYYLNGTYYGDKNLLAIGGATQV